MVRARFLVRMALAPAVGVGSVPYTVSIFARIIWLRAYEGIMQLLYRLIELSAFEQPPAVLAFPRAFSLAAPGQCRLPGRARRRGWDGSSCRPFLFLLT